MGASAGADGSQFGWIYEKLVAPTDSPAAPVGYTASQETRGELVQVSDSAATVRSGPSGDAAMLFGFPRGRELRLLSREPGWGELMDVRSNQVGWIAESSLQEPGQQTATSSRQRNGRGAYADAQEAAEQGGRLPWDQDRASGTGGINPRSGANLARAETASSPTLCAAPLAASD